MAFKIVDVVCKINEETHEPEYNLFDEMSRQFNWQSVTGDNDNKHFVLNDNVEIVCKDFEKARTHYLITTVQAKILLVINGTEHQLYSSLDTQFNPESRYFCLTIPDDGGMVLQLGTNRAENDTPEVKALSQFGTCVIFGIFSCYNYVKNDRRIQHGLYVPKTHGGITQSGSSYSHTPFDPTPFCFLTEDSERVYTTNMQFVNSGAKTTVISPICHLSSECISLIAKVELIGGGRTSRGVVEIGGREYYSIGGLFFR